MFSIEAFYLFQPKIAECRRAGAGKIWEQGTGYFRSSLFTN
jgi:hypothetical protein